MANQPRTNIEQLLETIAAKLKGEDVAPVDNPRDNIEFFLREIAINAVPGEVYAHEISLSVGGSVVATATITTKKPDELELAEETFAISDASLKNTIWQADVGGKLGQVTFDGTTGAIKYRKYSDASWTTLQSTDTVVFADTVVEL